MEWITDNAEAISAIASVLTLFVWVFYAQLLYANYSRQRRARIIINRGSGKHIDSLCLVSNMSAESIYVQHIVAVLEYSGRELQLDISDFQQASGEGPEYSTHQGPLGSGDYLHVGSFNNLLQRVADAFDIEMSGFHPKNGLRFDAIEIRLIAVYGPEDSPIGARRRFLLRDSGDDDYSIIPDSLDTKRLTSKRERRMIRGWMRKLATHETNAGNT